MVKKIMAVILVISIALNIILIVERMDAEHEKMIITQNLEGGTADNLRELSKYIQNNDYGGITENCNRLFEDFTILKVIYKKEIIAPTPGTIFIAINARIVDEKALSDEDKAKVADILLKMADDIEGHKYADDINSIEKKFMELKLILGTA